MKGLELARKYYEEYGKTMLEDYPQLTEYLAVGFVGSGSERYGFDDEVSQDHDFEPGFCIFLPGEDIVDRKSAFLLERAYAKLPKEFAGFQRQRLSPVGGNRNGVIRTADFYRNIVGAADGCLSAQDWLRIPDYALAEAVNGEIYFDSYGEFTRIRENLKRMPDDIVRKRLAGNLLLMAQAGQYNYVRCQQHKEPEAAQLAAVEYVNASAKVLFLLSGCYMPYYKWSFRALRLLEASPEGEWMKGVSEKLSGMLSGDIFDTDVCIRKYDAVEEIAAIVVAKLNERNLTKAVCEDLEKHAYSVNDGIEDGQIRNSSILAGI